MQIPLLNITGVIFHQVPQRPADSDAAKNLSCVKSHVEQAISPALQQYLRDQLLETFKKSTQAVCPDPDLDSPVPASAGNYLTAAVNGDTSSFVSMSHGLADLLYERQHLNAPEALIAVARGTAGDSQVLCIAKLEQQPGLSFEITGSGDVEVTLEEGLVLAGKDVVFKAAVFELDDVRGTIRGDVSDDQSGKGYLAPITDYWLRAFLGCRFANDADVQTRAFIKGIQKTLNADVADINDRTAGLDALNVELTSNHVTIDPMPWIEKFVPEDVQDRAVQRLRDAGAPLTVFPKAPGASDLALRTRYTWYEYTDGTRLKVPVEHTVEITQDTADGVDVLTVRGRISRIR